MATYLQEIDRRLFLRQLFAAATTAVINLSFRTECQAYAIAEDSPNTHNMLVFGEKKIYLSHLPMFDAVNKNKADYSSPHRYQALLEVTFQRSGQNLQTIYTDDRHQHPSTRIYTLNPEDFILTRLTSATPQSLRLTGFKADVFRGHLEKGGQLIGGLKQVEVKVNRLIQFRKFNPADSQPVALTYLLFGSTEELFLAHYITKPPDFDQVLSVKIDGHAFTDAELAKGIVITIPSKPNLAKERVKESQQVTGQLQTADPKHPLTFNLKVGKEIYFEEGELRVPPTFDDTPLEKQKI